MPITRRSAGRGEELAEVRRGDGPEDGAEEEAGAEHHRPDHGQDEERLAPRGETGHPGRAWPGLAERGPRRPRSGRERGSGSRRGLEEEHRERALAAAVFRRPFSASDWRTIAVEDIDRTRPTARASRPGMPRARAKPATTAVVAATCRPPSPRTGLAAARGAWARARGPTRNSIMTTPNSAKRMTSWPSSPTRWEPNGPIAMPARR